jgi:chemotaxis protein methyltransferase CheR
MNPEAAPHVDRFRTVLGRRLGLSFDDGAAVMLHDALTRRAGRARLLPSQYVGCLENGDGDDELRSLALELTTTETYFFRHHEQLEAFCDVAASARAASERPLRILSAGCASGEEPYSLAILLRERLPEVASQVVIVGIDVNARALENASRGRYSSWSLRRTNTDARKRWFREERNDFTLHPTIREMVHFERRNLVEEDAAFFRSEAFDVVLCRNVLMYFTPEATDAVIRRLAGCLGGGGFLFVGHAETWRVACPELELCQTHETFYYRKRDAHGWIDGHPRARERPQTQPSADDWRSAIARSAGRVTSLVDSSPGDCSPAKACGRALDPALAAQLVHEERYGELRELLAEAERSTEDPGHLLLHAVLLTRGGDTNAAERACERVIELDDTSAEARYLMALCRESRGDREGAKEQAAKAMHADPSFSLPHFYLGLLARRDGDLLQARRRLGQALALLEREDLSRLQLYGGGFRRETLVGLCRAELRSCEGST